MSRLVSIVDDALSPTDFVALKKKIFALGRERLRETYQTTFWFDFKNEPSNLIEQLVMEQLRSQIPARNLKLVKGVEWWLSRMRTSNVKVDFHVDRDNQRFDLKGQLRHPTVSSLLYLNTCRGGLLAVTKEPTNDANLACAPDIHDFDFVEPKANRFTYFKGNLTHGVLDSHNEIPGKRRILEPTLRQAIAINFWNQRPMGVIDFGKLGIYRTLAVK